MPIRCRQHSFGSESQFPCRTHHSAANVNSLQTTQLWQRIIISPQTTQFRQRMLICCGQHSFGSESQFRCRTHHSTANVNSLRTTQLRQWITISPQTTQFRQRMLIRYSRHSFRSESQFRCWTPNSAANVNFVAEHTIRQRMLIHCGRHNFSSKSQFHRRQLSFGSEC